MLEVSFCTRDFTYNVDISLIRVTAKAAELPEITFKGNEAAFRWAFNSDACAVEKSAEAMRRFGEDTEKLKSLLATML